MFLGSLLIVAALYLFMYIHEKRPRWKYLSYLGVTNEGFSGALRVERPEEIEYLYLRIVALCCSELQYVAVCCSVLHRA